MGSSNWFELVIEGEAGGVGEEEKEEKKDMELVVK